MNMKIGDKVTIYSSRGSSSVPVAVTAISEVKTRQYVTEDGRRWRLNGIYSHDEVDAKNQKISSRQMSAYRDGDEQRIIRAGLVAGARKLTSGQTWELERDLVLLSDEDLRLMGEIAERLEAARKARKSES